MKITKPGKRDGTVETNVYTARNVCDACGCEWYITSQDTQMVHTPDYSMNVGAWRLRAYSADSPMPGLFVECYCPSCGRFTQTRIGDAE